MTDIRDGVEQGGLTATAITAIWAAKEIIYDYEYQEESLTQNPVVQNTWYTVCDLTGGVKVYAILMDVDNTEENPQDFQVRATIDGVVKTSAVQEVGWAEPHTVHIYFTGNLDNGDLAFTIVINPIVTTESTFAFVNINTVAEGYGTAGGTFECQDFKLEIQQTDAVSTAPRLQCIVQTAQKVLT